LYNETKPSKYQPVNLAKKYASGYNFVRSVKPKDRGKEIYNSRLIINRLRADENVLGVAPKLNEPVFFNSGVVEVGGFVTGIDVDEELRLFSLTDYVIDGDLKDLDRVSSSIFIGKGMAQRMMMEKGDVIQITTGSGQLTTLKIVGILQFGIAEIDNIQSYASIETTRKLLGKPENYTTDIQVKLKDIEKAPLLARQFSELFDVEAIDIKQANAEFETGNRVRTTISYAVSITLLIVAGFGIYNILNMMIYEKMDSIAILKATGFSGADVKKIFIVLSMIIGVVGGVLGLGLGYVLSFIISKLPFESQSLPTVKTYPIDFNVMYYLVGLVFALLTTYVSGLFPAIRAKNVDPVQIIRGK
jgi:lipoprotein-releasing system permease protein